MGGYGSGRWDRQDVKAKTSSLPKIDVRLLKRRGLLVPGTEVGIEWGPSAGQLGLALLYTERDRLVMNYEYQPEGERKIVTETVFLDHTPCHFGGKRVWLHCPGCWRRVAVIYAAGGRFRCRQCCKLTYQSRSWSKAALAMVKGQRIRARLGGSGSLSEALPPKPKGMHLSTYYRTLRGALRAEHRFWSMVG